MVVWCNYSDLQINNMQQGACLDKHGQSRKKDILDLASHMGNSRQKNGHVYFLSDIDSIEIY